MRIAILSKEYSPYVYGGAGVHVEYLGKGLSKQENNGHEVQVLCFGDQRQSSNILQAVGQGYA